MPTSSGSPELDALLPAATRELRAALRDVGAELPLKVVGELALELSRRGLLALGTTETHHAHGILTDNGQAVQRVAPGDPGFEEAQPWVRHTIETPWVAEKR